MRSAITAARAAISPEAIADRVQRIARDYAAEYGRKGGLHMLGRWLGSDRRARGVYGGEARRIAADEYLLLLEAEAALRRARAVRLRAELDTLETEDAMDLDTSGSGLRVVR